MEMEKCDLMADHDVTTTQPQINPPAYSGAPQKGGSLPEDPDMNVIYLSIFTMLFCCWPCGLVGLIYGIQGMQQHYRGQSEQSQRTTKFAMKWTICGIVSGVIYVCAIVFLVIACYALGFGLAYGLADFDATTPTPTSFNFFN